MLQKSRKSSFSRKKNRTKSPHRLYKNIVFYLNRRKQKDIIYFVSVLEGTKILGRKLIISIVIALPLSVSAATTVSFRDEGTFVGAIPGGIVQIEIVDDLGLSSFDAVVCITGGARIVDVEFEHDGVYHLPYPVVEGPGCGEYGQFWSGNMPNGAVASVKIQYDSGSVIVSMSPGYLYGGTRSSDDTPAVFSDGVVTIVPEPASLLLLALGTFFLRRKRSII